VSPYFVPGERGADALCESARKGVKVRILTNSLVSNDVAAVHAGYVRHRKQLVRSGVQLYELNEQIRLPTCEGVLVTDARFVSLMSRAFATPRRLAVGDTADKAVCATGVGNTVNRYSHRICDDYLNSAFLILSLLFWPSTAACLRLN